MQFLIEGRDVVLKDEHIDEEKGHFDEVAQVHRLQPHSESEAVRPHVHLQVTVVVKAFISLKIDSASQSAFREVSVCRTVLKNISAYINLADPRVLHDSVDNFRLQSLEHPELGH